MKIEFLGTAGYHPNEERHTSCVLVPDAAPGAAFALDAGTGFFRLMDRPLPPRLHVFLSHAHLDHVAGLTYLLDVLHGRDCAVTLHSTAGTLQTATRQLFDSPLFPLKFGGALHAVEAGQNFEVEGVRVSTHALTHPGGSLAWRFDWTTEKGNVSLAYVTDTAGDGRYIEFVRAVDVLIHERNFPNALRELADASGHCTSEAALRVARQAQVKKLVLTHFNPLSKTDPAQEDGLHEAFPGVVFARDNQTLEF